MMQGLGRFNVPAPIAAASADALRHMSRPGRWWTGAERREIAGIARAAAPRPLWDRIPPLETIDHSSALARLSPFVRALVELIAVEPSSIDRATVDLVAQRIGDAAYAELCAVVAQLVAIDQLCHALGSAVPPLPAVEPGQPTRLRPRGMGDVGGHIEMTTDFSGPNVARSLSLAGEDHHRWRALVLSMYSRDGFLEMVWTDRALSRPQVELLAARTSALNECFY